MLFWLSKDASIPIREQLAAQLILGILSRRIGPGEKLPSVRQLARRLKIHANTVSAAYRELAARGWVTRRVGAGVFVCDRAVAFPSETAQAFAWRCVQDGLAHGYSLADLQSAFASALQSDDASEMVVIDPEREMACILAAEIAEATGRTVRPMNLADAAAGVPPAAYLLANAAFSAKVQSITGHRQVHAIQVKSMEEVVAGQHRPDRPILIGVASHSRSILEWSSTLLSSLGFPPDAVIQRDASQSGWAEGLRACDIVAVDVVTAREVPRELPIAVFRIVSDAFLSDFAKL